jgi:hypothetical protein
VLLSDTGSASATSLGSTKKQSGGQIADCQGFKISMQVSNGSVYTIFIEDIVFNNCNHAAVEIIFP